MSPIRQSNTRIIAVMTAVESRPEHTIMTTRVATFSRFCIVFVVTDMMRPRLFSL